MIFLDKMAVLKVRMLIQPVENEFNNFIGLPDHEVLGTLVHLRTVQFSTVNNNFFLKLKVCFFII